jgi:hypothetical protein
MKNLDVSHTQGLNFGSVTHGNIQNITVDLAKSYAQAY